MMSKQIIVVLLENRPGVLNRVAGLLRRRHYEIHSLSMGRSDPSQYLRMTLTIEGDKVLAQRVAHNLAKLIEVIHVEPLGDLPAVRRDLALIKVEPTIAALPQINALCEAFRASVIDVSPDSVIVEVTGDETKIDRFRSLLEPFGIVEMTRSECLAMGRGHHRLSAPEPTEPIS